MFPVTTKLGGKTVSHFAYDVFIEKRATATPFQYSSWFGKPNLDGQPDLYFHHDLKTTLDAKVITNNPNAISCGLELTFEGKTYVIEAIEYNAGSHYLRVIAGSREHDSQSEATSNIR